MQGCSVPVAASCGVPRRAALAVQRPFLQAGCRQHAGLASRRGLPVAVRAGLDVDNASILVAGGGGVALDVTRKLKDMGAWVWQLQRTDVRR